MCINFEEDKMETQEKTNNKIWAIVEKKNQDRINHLIKMEEWRAVAQTIEPIESMMKVYTNRLEGRHDWALQHLEPAGVLELVKPSKVTLLSSLVDSADLDAFKGFEKLGAQALLNGVFKKSVIDQLNERYESKSKEIWDDELKRIERYPIKEFDEFDLYKYCRPFQAEFPTRVQCAKAIDFAEQKIKNASFDIPKEIPFEREFVTALKKHY